MNRWMDRYNRIYRYISSRVEQWNINDVEIEGLRG